MVCFSLSVSYLILDTYFSLYICISFYLSTSLFCTCMPDFLNFFLSFFHFFFLSSLCRSICPCFFFSFEHVCITLLPQAFHYAPATVSPCQSYFQILSHLYRYGIHLLFRFSFAYFLMDTLSTLFSFLLLMPLAYSQHQQTTSSHATTLQLENNPKY